MSRDQVLANRDIRPAAFVHFVLQTSRLREQVDFYKAFLNAWEVFGSDMGSFLTYDEEHHRVAIAYAPDHASSSHPRVASELQGDAVLQSGVDVRVVRLPQVHDKAKQGLVSFVIAISRERRLAAYIEDGANLWPAAHVSDVARLYTLAIDKGQAGARYHAVGDEGIAFKEIAALIGAALEVPVMSLPAADAPQHFGWLAELAGLNMPASASWTRQALGWEPTGPSLITDLRQID